MSNPWENGVGSNEKVERREKVSEKIDFNSRVTHDERGLAIDVNWSIESVEPGRTVITFFNPRNMEVYGQIDAGNKLSGNASFNQENLKEGGVEISDGCNVAVSVRYEFDGK